MSKKEVKMEIEGRRKMSSAAMFYDFNANPLFVGRYVGQHLGMVEDPETKIKHEGLIGYDFVDDDGVEVIISNSHAITKALHADFDGREASNVPGIWEITFVGKIVNSKGKPFNRFDIFFTPDK